VAKVLATQKRLLTTTSSASPNPSLAHGVWWLLTLATCALGIIVAGKTIGQFGAGSVVLRGWMVIANALILGTQAVTLLALAKTAPSRWVMFVFALGALVALIHVALPFVVGTGPWSPGAAPLVVLRALTFFPSTAQDLGGLLVALALMRTRHPLTALAALAFIISVALSAWLWAVTPQAVMGRLHALAVVPIWCVAPLIARTLLVGALLSGSWTRRARL